MVTINVAYTQAINPEGAKPVITRAQLWAAMEMKVREAHKFVPVFSDCKVLEEHDNVIVRETTLKPMEGRPGKTQKETCKLYKPVKASVEHGVLLQCKLTHTRSTSMSQQVPSSPTWSLMAQT